MISSLLTGEGPLLKVFSEDGQLVWVQEAIPFRRVHGIRPGFNCLVMTDVPSLTAFAVTLSVDDDSGVLLVFGQKVFGISQLSIESSTVQSYSVQSLCEITETSDWILDALWLMYRDPSCLKIAFVTTHNTVLLYSVTDSSVSTVTYHSEVCCILYPLMFSTFIHP